MSKDRMSLIVPLISRDSTQSETIAFFTEDKSRIEVVEWEARSASHPPCMYLLNKDIRIGVRRLQILFILILFAQYSSVEGEMDGRQE